MGILDEADISKKRFTLEMNRRRGAVSERGGMTRSEVWGNEVQRTGHGSDWKERRVDIFGEKGPWTLVEHKSGGARLSKLQEKTRRNTSRYRQERD